jgi:hypothetical protein
MNKTTKRALKWLAGLLISALLLMQLYRQIRAQMASGLTFEFWPESEKGFFLAAVMLLFANIGVEAFKWKLLVQSAQPLRFSEALRSVLSGIAGSLITPNRIGEYPARIIALNRPNSSRLVSVSVLGACAQFLSLMVAGSISMAFFWYEHPKPLYGLVWTASLFLTILSGLIYFSFERWAPRIERFKLFARMKLWARLLRRFDAKEQWTILGLSLLRFFIFSLQYWLLLHWQGIPLTFFGGMLYCMHFFWAMAIIPTISLAELGIRGTLSVWLFSAFSGNAAGIVAATFVLWCLNLLVPALIGTVLFLPRLKAKSS